MTENETGGAQTHVTQTTHEVDVTEISGTSKGWLRQALTVAGLEYRLAFRNRWVPALTGLFALFSVGMVAFAGSNVGPTSVTALVVSLTELGTYLVPLVALAFSYDAIVGAAERGWLELVLALPASRSSIAVGTYLGRAATLSAAMVVGFGIGGATLVMAAGPSALGPYFAFVLAAVGTACAFLGIGVFISALASERTRALGAVLLVWTWFALGHDLLALGAVTEFELGGASLSALVIANPADVFRVLVLLQLDAVGGGWGAIAAETGLSVPVLAAGLVAWICVPVFGIVWAIDRRRR
ncbi:ABC transporter permease [Haladaptatus sp. NG-SE-30]